ncbi:MAG: heme o synthase [Rhodospirillales bacterium]
MAEATVASTLTENSSAEPSVRDFLALLKPRVMSLVVFSGAAGLFVAPGSIHPVLAAVAIICIAIGAGASGAINMWYDADIDAAMTRTAKRPIPSGLIDPSTALSFGCVLAAGSVALMGVAINWAAAAILAITIGFYVFIYTMWLKRSTPQNIVIGGAAGAFPPMIGWAAVTGDLALGSAVLFLIIFFWTPPHFWALALYRANDYAAAGVPMLPVVAGRAETRKQILIYSLILAPIGVLPSFVGVSSAAYGGFAALLGLLFVVMSFQLFRSDDDRDAKRLFGFSILYLFLLFGGLIADHALMSA